MHGRPPRSQRQKSDTKEESQPKTVQLSLIGVDSNQQKLQNSNNEKTRPDSNDRWWCWRTDAYPPFTQNIESIIIALRFEFDQKIEKANHASPDVSALIQEMITLRRDANALLEARSAPRPKSSDGPSMEELPTILEAKTSADMLNPMHNHLQPVFSPWELAWLPAQNYFSHCMKMTQLLE